MFGTAHSGPEAATSELRHFLILISYLRCFCLFILEFFHAVISIERILIFLSKDFWCAVLALDFGDVLGDLEFDLEVLLFLRVLFEVEFGAPAFYRAVCVWEDQFHVLF